MSAPEKDDEATVEETHGTQLADPVSDPLASDVSGDVLGKTLSRSDPAYVSMEEGRPVEKDRYELRGELGRGGQSVVHRAFDVRLEREVAIKELHADSSDAAKDRFWREARITARLEHPNIVPVYEIGKRNDGSLYCVQKLVRSDSRDGSTRTLRAALNDSKKLEQRLQLMPRFLAVCQGIAYAHAQGVLHRDLKPENVVLGQFGETVILDWGLARAVGDASRPKLPVSGEAANTVAGVAYGTPAYMSPEQARGEVVKIDARSDVWSLGAMLFELLAGRPPFVGRGAMDVVEQVKSAPVPDARSLSPQAPPELAAIARRALQRDPEQRFPTAAALADEIIAWQSSRKVSVYDYSLVEAFELFRTRHAAATSAGLAIFTAVCVSALLGWQFYGQAQRANAHTLIQKARAADRQLKWNEAALYYAAARLYDDNPETQWGVRTQGTRRVPPPRRLANQTQDVKSLAWSPDGTRIAAGVLGGSMFIFDAATGSQLRSVVAHKDFDVLGVAWSADGNSLATAGSDGRALLWDANALTSARKPLASGSEAVNRVALSPDGKWAAVAFEHGGLDLVDLSTDARIHVDPTDERHPVYSVSIDPSSQRLALVTWSGLLEIRSASGALVQALPRVAPTLLDVKYSPDGKFLAVAGNDKFVRVYRVDARGQVDPLSMKLFEGHDSKIYALAFSGDSRVLASAGTDQTLRLWHVVSGRPLIGRSLGGLGELEALALSPDGRSAVVGGQDNPGELYRLAEDDAVPSYEGDRLEGLVSQPGLDWYVYATGSGPLVFRNTETTPLERGEMMPGTGREVAVSRSGKAIAWACAYDSVCYAEAPGLLNAVRIPYPFGDIAKELRFVRAVGVANDVSWVAAADQLGDVRLWSLPDRAQKFVLSGHTNSVYSIDASPDGKVLATGSYDHSIRLWDLTNGTLLGKLEGHALGVRRVRFSPDGRLLASTGWDRSVRVWDVAARKLLCRCAGHEDHVFGLDWAPDGTWLASAGRDGTVRIWKPTTCEALATRLTDESRVYGLAAWGDGKGLTYSGSAVHRFAFQPLLSPRDQFRELEKSTGLTLDEERLEAVPRKARGDRSP